MSLNDSMKLLELQTKIIYNIATNIEIDEFESMKKNLKQSEIGSLKWFRSECDKLRKQYISDLVLK